MFKLSLIKRFIAVTGLFVLLFTFQNCSPGSSSRNGGDSNLNLSMGNPISVDWSFTTAVATKTGIKDYYNVWFQSYYGADHAIFSNGSSNYLLYDLRNDTSTSITQLTDGSVSGVMPFYPLGKIFYAESSAVDGRKFLNAYTVATQQTKRVTELSPASTCAAYPNEIRIPKIICTATHSTKKNDQSVILINVETLAVKKLAETTAGMVNLDYQLQTDIYDVQNQYRRSTFIYPKEDKAILEAYDVVNRTTKFYLFTTTSVTEFKNIDQDDFWGDGVQMTFADALQKMSPSLTGSSDTQCLGVDYTGSEIGSASIRTCTPYGLYGLVVTTEGYFPKLCRTLTDCDEISLDEPDFRWRNYAYSTLSPHLNSVIFSSSISSFMDRVQAFFHYDFRTKTFKKLLHSVPSTNQGAMIAVANQFSTTTFLMASEEIYKLNSGGYTRALAFYNYQNQLTIPLPLIPSLKNKMTAIRATVQDGDFYAAITSPNQEELVVLTSTMQTYTLTGYQFLQSFSNKNGATTGVYLQKEVSPGNFEVYQWNVKNNTVNKIFSDTAWTKRGIAGLFKNDKIIFYRKYTDNASACTTTIRDSLSGNVIREFMATTDYYCGSFGAFALEKIAIFNVADVYPNAQVYKYEYATKAFTALGATRYSGSVTEIQIDQTYYQMGNVLVTATGDLKIPSTTLGWLYDSFLNKGSLIYALQSYRDPENVTAYRMQELNPSTMAVTNLEELGRHELNLYPTDAGFYFTSKKTADGITIECNSRTFNLKGSDFQQVHQFIFYTRQISSGQWQYVYTDITSVTTNETVLASEDTYAQLIKVRSSFSQLDEYIFR